MVLVVGAASAQADEYVKGGFEMTGHVNAGASYQHHGGDGSASATVVRSAAANPAIAAIAGPQADLTQTSATAPYAKKESIIGFVDEAEIDVMKSFGENIRARADFAFGRIASGSNFTGARLEQAYATANIPVGNGLEFLIGRFDAPIGFESVERAENTLFSHGVIFNTLRPQTLTGVKFYYPFSDMIDWHVYLVNNLSDTLAGGNATGDPALPSFGTRVGFKWGDEGKQSTFGISLAGGPEVVQAGDKLDLWSWMADVDWNVWVTESFAIGGEGIYRTDNAPGAATDGRYYAGQLNLNYAFNDVWDGTLRYVFAQQNGVGAGSGALGAGSLLAAAPAALVGVKQQTHELTLGGQYQIADGAKVQLEYRLDLVKPTGLSRGITHGGLLNFAYSF
ncbi:MAG: outer membrane beta-barrel protein [Deltaproteobacteria bacterium]|nr:outer membrane beta-barrel protein [Deltaproteobacteria bacterium]